MKKIFLLLTILCLLAFISCKKTADAVKEAAGAVTKETKNAASASVEGDVEKGAGAGGAVAEAGVSAIGGLTELISGVPQLKDAASTTVLAEYGGLIMKLVAAAKSGNSDTASLQANVAEKFKEVVKVIQTLSLEEKAKATEWIGKISALVGKK